MAVDDTPSQRSDQGFAFPLRPGVKSKQVGRAFRGGSNKAIGRVVAGPPTHVQGLISQGSTNDNNVKFARKGRVAIVCKVR